MTALVCIVNMNRDIRWSKTLAIMNSRVHCRKLNIACVRWHYAQQSSPSPVRASTFESYSAIVDAPVFRGKRLIAREVQEIQTWWLASMNVVDCVHAAGEGGVQCFFTARRNARIASAVLATAIPSVCLSVRSSACPSVTRRYCVRTTARCSLHCQIAKCV